MNTLAYELEDAVIDAWPAAECEELDGWLLRASGGPTRRGNSVATLEAGTTLTLTQRIEQAEAFYHARARPTVIQVGPCARPAGLDQTLLERGYRIDGEAIAAVANPGEVLARVPRTLETSVAITPSEAWLGIAGRSSRFADSEQVF